jgi:small subunit ribosomal protein S14
MAKKCLKIRNERRKKISQLHKVKRRSLSDTAKNESVSFEERLVAQIALAKMPRDGSVVRYRNRCSITGRPRGNFRKFGISRIALRELASWGQVPGLVKSSW